MTLAELVEVLRRYANGALPLTALHDHLRPLLAADPLDVAESDPSPWLKGPEDERLFWRLVYHVESTDTDTAAVREGARRIVTSLDRTGSAATTHELLPVLIDQPRFCIIARKYQAGQVSRTGFLSVIAESGYPSHIKLWLQHAPPGALEKLCQRLESGEYDLVAHAFEAPPA